MAQAKPRILNDSRDLVWSLIPLLAIALLIAGLAGSCSWGFGTDAGKQVIPSFDSETALRVDAENMSFPIREPELPQDWKSNSGSSQPLGSSMMSTVGWITPAGAYVQLTQTGATEDRLVPALGDQGVLGSGMKEIGGHKWVAYENIEQHNKIWVTDLGDVRIAVMSRGSDAEMETLAKAIVAAQPLPKRS
ncbi:MAG: DUF4245 domain-containing protein [Gordonia sp. (in: high G+C Gram-positive bacteria)]